MARLLAFAGLPLLALRRQRSLPTLDCVQQPLDELRRPLPAGARIEVATAVEVLRDADCTLARAGCGGVAVLYQLAVVAPRDAGRG